MKRYLNIIAMLLALILTFSVFALAEETEPTDPVTPPTTSEPTDKPEEKPTETPTEKPTETPTEKPTEKPTEEPTKEPTTEPTVEPHIHEYTVLLREIPSTCQKAGLKEWKCSKCDDHQVEVLPKAEHKMEIQRYIKEPTCEEDGMAQFICSLCNIERKVDTVPAKGHTAGDWEIVTPAKPGKAGEQQKKCTVCGKVLETEVIPALPKRPSTPSTTEQPVAEDVPALPYGSIVSDVTRADETYAAVVAEEGANHVLVITADPDEAGAYTLRNLHITDELLAKMAADHIEIVRFVVGTATVEFPVASFTGEVMTTIKADLASPAKEFIVTVDPTATTAEGNPGCSVSASIACEDGSEFDITGVVEGLTVTMNGVAQAVTEAAVYAA